MKQRLLVMNGQRLVQSEQAGQWSTDKVEKAGAVTPGIYDIHLAKDADKTKRHDGQIIYLDNTDVFQQVGKHIVKHARSDFDNTPAIGTNVSVKYHGGRAVTGPTAKLGRRM